MPRISVKAVEGRIARTAPDGIFIPHDEYVEVVDTKYIRRLLEVHGDIVLKPAKQAAPVSSDSKVDTGNQPSAPKIAPKTKE